MKKFSSITNQKVGTEPVSDNKIDEKMQFKMRVLGLLEQFLSVRTYGPVDRYINAGSIKIAGKELFTEALLSLLDEKTIKDQTKLLESLKSDVKDWEAIDNKIEKLSKGGDFNTNYKVSQLLEMYNDEGMLVNVIEEKSKKFKLNTLKSYLETFNEVKGLKSETKSKIIEILNDRISNL